MALIPCPACGSRVSDRAAACPRCGADPNASLAPAEAPAIEIPNIQPGVEPRVGVVDHEARWAPPHLRAAITSEATPTAPFTRPPAHEQPLGDLFVSPPSQDATADPLRNSRSLSTVVLSVVTIVVLAVGGFTSWAWSHPVIEIHNALLDATDVTTPGQSPRRIEAGASLRFRTSRGPMPTSWQTKLEGPSRDSRGLGQRVSHAQVFTPHNAPFGATTFTLSSRTAEAAYFAPLITNNSTQPLRIVINWQLSTASGGVADQECRCIVAPGATRQFIGYYRLYANSNVRAITPVGRAAMFESFGTAVDPNSGRVLLKYHASDFTKP
jgi:hypothetical protein